jgi:hypothetical protein
MVVIAPADLAWLLEAAETLYDLLQRDDVGQ